MAETDWGADSASSQVSCPKCTQGKHRNCTGWAIDAMDVMVDCACPECY